MGERPHVRTPPPRSPAYGVVRGNDQRGHSLTSWLCAPPELWAPPELRRHRPPATCCARRPSCCVCRPCVASSAATAGGSLVLEFPRFRESRIVDAFAHRRLGSAPPAAHPKARCGRAQPGAPSPVWRGIDGQRRGRECPYLNPPPPAAVGDTNATHHPNLLRLVFRHRGQHHPTAHLHACLRSPPPLSLAPSPQPPRSVRCPL